MKWQDRPSNSAAPVSRPSAGRRSSASNSANLPSSKVSSVPNEQFALLGEPFLVLLLPAALDLLDLREQVEFPLGRLLPVVDRLGDLVGGRGLGLVPDVHLDGVAPGVTRERVGDRGGLLRGGVPGDTYLHTEPLQRWG